MSDYLEKGGKTRKGGKFWHFFLSIMYNKNAVLYVIQLRLCIIEIPDNERNRSDRVEVALCGVQRGKSGKRGQYLFQSIAYMRSLSTDQISTPHNKRQENQSETQLSMTPISVSTQSQICQSVCSQSVHCRSPKTSKMSDWQTYRLRDNRSVNKPADITICDR